jgi:hypothetical protein
MRLTGVILSIFFLSCTNNETDSNMQESVTNADKDTVFIGTEIGDTLKFSRENFNKIKNKHSEFIQEYPENPDQLYHNITDNEEFGSEVGQDVYYALYAYFLKQKNGVDKYSKQRKRIIDMYPSEELHLL